ncbi:hypothetical protein BDZ89DRAFT_1065573 [Hymenopellis radicata]|nr:hypothetical protein BDZ89DRAFT_1065573 [Hymenopellis radicata]
MSNTFDAAVFALALCAFWGCCRLGELTIPSRNAFSARLHVSRSAAITYRSHAGGLESAHVHIPWAKMERQSGADLTFTSPLRHHLSLNAEVPKEAPLFAFLTADGSWTPMTKEWFLGRCRQVWSARDMDYIHGHGFRPGGATELLLGGVPPETVAKVGRWKSLAFLIYWRKLEDLIPLMISRTYDSDRITEINQKLEDFRKAHKIPKKICISRS